jgi:ABC-type branched-subunit amino acid transport system substrate-binding protein
LAMFGSLGTAPQTAVHKYLNSKGVPQLLLNTGASKWNDPKNNKWTMAGLPLYPTEARILARHVLNVKPNAKVAILYQNDDFGRDFLDPFKQVLADAGGNAKVIAEVTYDLTDPTIDSQLINLSKSGADVFYNISTGKATSQSIRKLAELGWKPLHLLSAGSTGRSILSAAGFENATGIVAIRYAKEVGVSRWEKDPDVMAFEELRKKYLPTVDPDNTIAFAGYGQVVTMAEILRRCGDNLTRANVLKQAATLDIIRPTCSTVSPTASRRMTIRRSRRSTSRSSTARIGTFPTSRLPNSAQVGRQVAAASTWHSTQRQKVLT